MAPPAEPKIYHIAHVDRLASIIADGAILSDAALQERPRAGTTIGMSAIKRRRLTNPVKCQPGLNVGGGVPFYFCPRSVMLYLIHMANHVELDYRGGQDPIVHLEADLQETVDRADQNGRRWAFTLSNAGSGYFKDRCDLAQLDEIDWNAVQARDWRACKEGKQAESLVERALPWSLIRRVGVRNAEIQSRATEAIRTADHQPADHQPAVTTQQGWHY